MRRVLITGSRNWSNFKAVWDVLDLEWEKAATAGQKLVVVHGKCKTGADLHAHGWCVHAWEGGFTNVDEDPHPADIVKYHPKRAPLVRNQEMAESGIAAAHAFPNEGSTGTRNCMSHCFANGVTPVNHGFQPYTNQAREFAVAYLSRTPKPVREGSL